MYRNILVPLDGSTFGEYALPLALALARKSNATLQLVHVHPPLAVGYLEGAAYIDESLEEHAKQQEQAYLDNLAQRLREIGRIPVTTRLLTGQVSESIQAWAREQNVDLIVLTSHGRGAIGRFWLGSVADELIRHVPMPLLLVRPEEGKPDLTQEILFKRIILPLDGTPVAEEMIGWALELGTLTGAEFVLLRSVAPPTPYSYQFDVGSVGQVAQSVIHQIEEMQQKMCKEAEEYLAKIAERFKSHSLKVQTRVVVEVQPAVAILEEGNHKHQDLIALETHGRHGLARLILGSVADKVIRGAAVPVLVHRPWKKK